MKRHNGWTGGQYSVFRALLALYLLADFLLSASPITPLLPAVALSALFGIGFYDRAAAVGLGILLVLLGDLASLPAAWLLLAHILLPAAPYGSWMARGRTDPAGQWRVPHPVYMASWAALALSYGFLAYTRLPGALWGLALLQIFAFDPAWIKPSPEVAEEMVFYDGHCGLCHRAVRFILAEDRAGAFRFAPLGGDRFNALVPEADRSGLPDSVVIRTAEGRLLARSSGVAYLFGRLGGFWRVFGAALKLIPPAVRDGAYDAIARTRYRLFGRVPEVCPILPPGLRERFKG